MRVETGVPGHVMPYDPVTAPQPQSHLYRLSENQEFYPNKKWNCSGNHQCYPRKSFQEQRTCPPATTSCYDTEGPQG